MNRQPPYHLKPNKAVDRLTLVDILTRLEKKVRISAYKYYGFGGPFLEDFRIVNQFFPDVRMVSIDEDADVVKRQSFNMPCKHLRLMKDSSTSFLSTYPGGEKCVFWLDYTGLKYAAFDDFMNLLGKVGDWSVVKITVRADLNSSHPKRTAGIVGREEQDRIEAAFIEDFRRKFGAVIPGALDYSMFRSGKFVSLLQDMFRVAAQNALPAAAGRMFHPLSSFFYSDQTQMFSLTGIVCNHADASKVRRLFKDWYFANIDWREPTRIDVPVLSTKERLHLARHLPCKATTGRCLMRALGYNIDGDEEESRERMKQYADFYKYSPYFVKATP